MSRYEELIAELALILIEGAKEHVGDLGPDDDEFECARELAIDATRSASSVRDDLMEAMKKAKPPVPSVPERPLTDAEKAKVVEDFKEWSGGFAPDESDEDEIRTYVEAAADNTLPRAALQEFLESYGFEDDEKPT